MNVFTEHPAQQGITYREHFDFALGIAIRLLFSVMAFSLHAVFPFIGIRRSLDLEAMTEYMQKQNRWIENVKSRNPARHDNSIAWHEVGP